MLRTYRLADAADFILHLLEKQQDDLLWEIWLHRKPTKTEGKETKYMSFDEYKKSVKTATRKKAETLTPEQEQQRLEFASQFIKTRKEIGDGSS